MKSVLNVVFGILKAASYIWMMIITGLAVFVSFTDGQPHIGSRILIFTIFNSVPIGFLIWRYKKDKDIRFKKKKEKLERKKEEEIISQELKEIEENEKMRSIKEKNDIKQRQIEKMNEAEIIDSKMIYKFNHTGKDNSKSAENIVTIDGNWVSIKRNGMLNFINHGIDGEKKINIKNISGVQFKEAGQFVNGYIQLIIQGSQESKGGILAAGQDENTVIFNMATNELAKKLVKELENRIDKLQNNNGMSQTVINQQVQTPAQQLKEFKELLDSGIITQEEFEKKKAELLN